MGMSKFKVLSSLEDLIMPTTKQTIQQRKVSLHQEQKICPSIMSDSITSILVVYLQLAPALTASRQFQRTLVREHAPSLGSTSILLLLPKLTMGIPIETSFTTKMVP